MEKGSRIPTGTKKWRRAGEKLNTVIPNKPASGKDYCLRTKKVNDHRKTAQTPAMVRGKEAI